jgi:hypothetical protein
MILIFRQLRITYDDNNIQQIGIFIIHVFTSVFFLYKHMVVFTIQICLFSMLSDWLTYTAIWHI